MCKKIMREQDFYDNMLKYSLVVFCFYGLILKSWRQSCDAQAGTSFSGRHLTTPRRYAHQQEEQEEVAYHISRKIILVFEMGVTLGCDAFCVWCSSEGLTSSPPQTVHLIHNTLTKGDVHLKLRCQPISIFLFWHCLPHLNKVLCMHLEG